jgi:membrane associated rhomboid family serine protease
MQISPVPDNSLDLPVLDVHRLQALKIKLQQLDVSKAAIDGLDLPQELAKSANTIIGACRPRIPIIVSNIENIIWQLNVLKVESERLELGQSPEDLAGNIPKTIRHLLNNPAIKRSELRAIAVALLQLARVRLPESNATRLEMVCQSMNNLVQADTINMADLVTIAELKALETFWRSFKFNWWLVLILEFAGRKAYYFNPPEELAELSQVLSVQVSIREKTDWLFYLFLLTICISFCLLRLDAIDHSQATRNAIITALQWTTCYMPVLAKPWTPLTCMWVHGSWWHLAANTFSFLLTGYWLSKAYGNKAWRWFCFVGSYLGCLAQCYLLKCPPADFTHWHGHSLVSIYHLPDTPLAGASGGGMAMLGAATAAALICWFKRKQGVTNPMGITAFVLLSVFLLQAIYDMSDPGVAGLAHQASWIVGFLLGFLFPVRSAVKLMVSRSNVATTKMAVYDAIGRSIATQGLYLSQTFDPQTDFIACRQTNITGKEDSHTLTLAGNPQVALSAKGDISLPVPLKRVQLSRKNRIRAIIVSTIMWYLITNHLAHGSIKPVYIAFFIFGVLYTAIDSMYGSLGYKIRPESKAVDY